MKLAKRIKLNGLKGAMEHFDSQLVLYNDAVSIIHDATKVCWDKPPAQTYFEKKEFIRKRIGTGHESITEHGNICMIIIIDEKYAKDIILNSGYPLKYLNVRCNYIESDKAYAMLIGGSIRGYKHFFRTVKDLNSLLVRLIMEELYRITPNCFWIDMIGDGVMANRFVQVMTTNPIDEEFNETISDYSEYHRFTLEDESRIEIINADDVSRIIKAADYYGFTIDDCLDMATVTIKFKGMSRVITQQLTRHRNGITQASGRYIDLSEKVQFNSPAKFKDKYDANKKYSIIIGEHKYALTMQELGDLLCAIYPQMKAHGIDKEDCRGYLPQNAQCGDIYMTFTYRSLIKFLELRTHSSAQAEIREYAIDIFDGIITMLQSKLQTNNIYTYLEPIYNGRELITDEYAEIDEPIDEVVEEVIEEETNNA